MAGGLKQRAVLLLLLLCCWECSPYRGCLGDLLHDPGMHGAWCRFDISGWCDLPGLLATWNIGKGEVSTTR